MKITNLSIQNEHKNKNICTHQIQRVEVDLLEGVVVEGRVQESVVGAVGDAGEGRGRDHEVVAAAAAAVEGATVARGRCQSGMIADPPQVGEDGGDVPRPAALHALAGRGGGQVVVIHLPLPRFQSDGHSLFQVK